MASRRIDLLELTQPPLHQRCAQPSAARYREQVDVQVRWPAGVDELASRSLPIADGVEHTSVEEPWVRQGGTTFTFVTEGIESALEQASAAAGDKDVRIAGGANTVRQFIKAGLIDELHIHLAPLLLGDGVRLFEHTGPELVELESTHVIDSPKVTHLRYRVVKED